MKKLFTLILAGLLTASVVACSTPAEDTGGESSTTTDNSSSTQNSESETSEAEPSVLDGEKPVLKILYPYMSFDPYEQPGKALSDELSGYETEWYLLPAENSVEKLMLEISGGAEYDLLKTTSTSGYGQLVSQNALMDISGLLEEHGDFITSQISDLGWTATTSEDGAIYGIPHEEYGLPRDSEDAFGLIKGGIGFRSDVLEEIDAELPSNLDEFYDVLVQIRDELGIIPLTITKTEALFPAILSAFGMGDPEWYDVDGVYTPRIKHPQMVDYLAFMQKLYSEELIDADMAINATENMREKFTTKNAGASRLFFWDLPSLVDALYASNPDVKTPIVGYLAPGSEEVADIYASRGALNAHCIPTYTSPENAAHVINYLNILSDPEVFREIYIGEEGVSYEVIDGKYFPLFPAFDEFQNSDKFVAVTEQNIGFEMWQARARKTPEMAETYEQMNGNMEQYNWMAFGEKYAFSQDVVQENRTSLNTYVADNMLKAIVEGTDPQTAINEMITEWDATGGLEYEAAMQEWYDENKDNIE